MMKSRSDEYYYRKYLKYKNKYASKKREHLMRGGNIINNVNISTLGSFNPKFHMIRLVENNSPDKYGLIDLNNSNLWYENKNTSSYDTNLPANVTISPAFPSINKSGEINSILNKYYRLAYIFLYLQGFRFSNEYYEHMVPKLIRPGGSSSMTDYIKYLSQEMKKDEVTIRAELNSIYNINPDSMFKSPSQPEENTYSNFITNYTKSMNLKSTSQILNLAINIMKIENKDVLVRLMYLRFVPIKYLIDPMSGVTFINKIKDKLGVSVTKRIGDLVKYINTRTNKTDDNKYSATFNINSMDFNDLYTNATTNNINTICKYLMGFNIMPNDYDALNRETDTDKSAAQQLYDICKYLLMYLNLKDLQNSPGSVIPQNVKDILVNVTSHQDESMELLATKIFMFQQGSFLIKPLDTKLVYNETPMNNMYFISLCGIDFSTAPAAYDAFYRLTDGDNIDEFNNIVRGMGGEEFAGIKNARKDDNIQFDDVKWQVFEAVKDRNDLRNNIQMIKLLADFNKYYTFIFNNLLTICKDNSIKHLSMIGFGIGVFLVELPPPVKMLLIDEYHNILKKYVDTFNHEMTIYYSFNPNHNLNIFTTDSNFTFHDVKNTGLYTQTNGNIKLVLHRKDAKEMAYTLATENSGENVAIINASDCIALMFGKLGYYTFESYCDRHAGEEDFGWTTTAMLGANDVYRGIGYTLGGTKTQSGGGLSSAGVSYGGGYRLNREGGYKSYQRANRV